MQRPTAVISPYGSVSDTIDMKPVRTPTTRQGNGWLLKRGFEDTSVFITPDLMVDQGGPVTLNLSSGGHNLVSTEEGNAFEGVGPTKNYIKNPKMKEIEYKDNYTNWNTLLNGPAREAKGWTGYNGGVRDVDKTYHAHVIEGGGPNGENAYRLINKYTELGIAPITYLAPTTTLTPEFNQDASHGMPITISFDMKVSHTGKVCRTGLYRYDLNTGARGFGSTSQNHYCSEANVWERKSYTTVVDNNWDLTKACTLYMYGQQPELEGILWVANVQVELSPSMTPLAEGDMGGPNRWLGTPYDSTSERRRGNTYWNTIGRLQASEGTFIVRGRSLTPGTSTYLFLRSGGSPSTTFQGYLSGTRAVVSVGSGGTHSLTGIDVTQFNTVVVSWKAGESWAAVNGIKQTTASYTNFPDIAGGIYIKPTAYDTWSHILGWVGYTKALSPEEVLALSGRKNPWDYHETSRFDLQYLTQPATVLVFYRTSPEMPVQSARFSESGDIGGVGYIDMHSTGLSVRTYDRMILDSVVLFNENLSTQDEQDFVKIPPAYQNHLVDTTRSGRVVQGYGDKQLLVNELPKSLTGNKYYQLLVSSV